MADTATKEGYAEVPMEESDGENLRRKSLLEFLTENKLLCGQYVLCMLMLALFALHSHVSYELTRVDSSISAADLKIVKDSVYRAVVLMELLNWVAMALSVMLAMQYIKPQLRPHAFVGLGVWTLFLILAFPPSAGGV